jgi:pyrroloquinoline quinone (PQQ) biosynthesis protein C
MRTYCLRTAFLRWIERGRNLMRGLAEEICAIRDANHTKDHRFFDLWAAGELTHLQIAQYLAQHFQLPRDLEGTVGPLFAKAPSDVRFFLVSNLAEEYGLINDDGKPPHEHNRMLLDFIALCGIDEATVRTTQPLPSLQAYFDKQWRLAYNEVWQVFMAASAALESQMVGVQKRIIPALRTHYAFPKGDPRVAWFEEHETADERHGSRALELVEKHVVEPTMAERCKAAVLDCCKARLRYLDEVVATYIDSPAPALR